MDERDFARFVHNMSYIPLLEQSQGTGQATRKQQTKNKMPIFSFNFNKIYLNCILLNEMVWILQRLRSLLHTNITTFPWIKMGLVLWNSTLFFRPYAWTFYRTNTLAEFVTVCFIHSLSDYVIIGLVKSLSSNGQQAIDTRSTTR